MQCLKAVDEFWFDHLDTHLENCSKFPTSSVYLEHVISSDILLLLTDNPLNYLQIYALINDISFIKLHIIGWEKT